MREAKAKLEHGSSVSEIEEHLRNAAALIGGEAIPTKWVCSYCNAIAIRDYFKKCAECRRAAYCSKECQRPVHKAVCKSAPKESCSQKMKAGASLISLKATTQNPWDTKHKVKVNCGNLVAESIKVCYLQLVHFVKVMRDQIWPISCFLFKLNF